MRKKYIGVDLHTNSFTICVKEEGVNDIIKTYKLNGKELSRFKTLLTKEYEVEYSNKISTETRYYITSLTCNAKKIADSIRSHWAIENSLHWVLDMTFNDDASRIRKKNAPANMAVIKHIALNLIRRIQQKRQSIKMLRKKAGWDNTTLNSIITQKFFEVALIRLTDII